MHEVIPQWMSNLQEVEDLLEKKFFLKFLILILCNSDVPLEKTLNSALGVSLGFH